MLAPSGGCAGGDHGHLVKAVIWPAEQYLVGGMYRASHGSSYIVRPVKKSASTGWPVSCGRRHHVVA